jgi:hypothetical protein
MICASGAIEGSGTLPDAYSTNYFRRDKCPRGALKWAETEWMRPAFWPHIFAWNKMPIHTTVVLFVFASIRVVDIAWLRLIEE